MERNCDIDVLEGGYCKDGVGGVSNFMTGDDGSSFLILFTPGSCRSWFLQTSPNTPNSAFLINSLFNWTNFSTLSVLLFNFLAITISLFALLWFTRSSWSKSWRLNSSVFCWTRWMYELSSIIFGSVKKYCHKLMSPWPNWGFMGFCCVSFFFEQVFIEGVEWRIWTIIGIALDRVRGYQVTNIWYIFVVSLTVVVQGHFCIRGFRC